MCHPAEVLEMTKYRGEQKQLKQLGVRGRECYPLASCKDSMPRATSLGTITCFVPSSQCSTHWLQREVSRGQVVTLGTPKHLHTDCGEPCNQNLLQELVTS